MMFFLDEVTDACGEDLLSVLGIIRNKVIPMIQIAIIAALVILLIIDLGKAVMAGKEDEIKSAQKLAIKRVVYALVVFLVPLIVNVAISLVTPKTGSKASASAQDAGQKSTSALECWKAAKDY